MGIGISVLQYTAVCCSMLLHLIGTSTCRTRNTSQTHPSTLHPASKPIHSSSHTHIHIHTHTHTHTHTHIHTCLAQKAGVSARHRHYVVRLYFRGLRFKDPQNFQGLGFVSKVQGLGPVHTPVTRSTRGGLLRRCFEEANALVYRHTHSHLYTLPRAPYMHTYTHTRTSLPCSSRVGLHKASPHTPTRTQTHTYIPDLLNTRGTP